MLTDEVDSNLKAVSLFVGWLLVPSESLLSTVINELRLGESLAVLPTC